MKKSVYVRGKIGMLWYNFTECFAYIALHRKTPDTLQYTPRVKYGSGRQQFLNLCTRKDTLNEKKPLFVYIHGGGWVSGITDMRDTYIANWAEKGFFTASIAYTYAPTKVYPAQLHEIFSAIDYIYDHADEWNIDTSKVVFAGESAGGYYIMYAALIATDKSYLDKLGINFKHREEFHIDALVSHCGCFNLPALIDENKQQSNFPDMKMFVTSFLGKDLDEAKAFLKTPEGELASPKVIDGFPPVFVVRCCRDWLRYEAMDLMEDLKAHNIPYGEFEGTGIIGNHAWSIATIVKKGRDCFDKSYDFVMKFI